MARSTEAKRAVGPLIGAAGGGGRGPVDADPDHFPLRHRDLLGGFAEQGDRGAPRDQPTQVGGERPVDSEVQRAGYVAGGERGTGPQIDQPLSVFEPPAQLLGVGGLRWAQVRRRRAGGVGRAHVRVVGREGVQPGEKLGDVTLLVLGQYRVGGLLDPDRGGGGLGLGGGAEAAEPVGGHHLRSGRVVPRPAAARRRIGGAPGVGVPGPEQVRAAGGTEQQRPSGEHRGCAVVLLQHVGQMGVGVPGVASTRTRNGLTSMTSPSRTPVRW